MSTTVRSYGSWSSPIDASLLAETGVSLSQVRVSKGTLYWIEGRPREAGRCVIVRLGPGGATEDVLPEEYNARTRVHEYGGGSLFVHQGEIFFSHFADQRLYRMSPGREPAPITPEPPEPATLRYADCSATPDGERLFYVRESHAPGREPVNDIVCLPPDGSHPPRSVVSGADFYSNPRVSPDGRYLAWIAWNHPDMPWDRTELWVGELAGDGSITSPRCVAGRSSEESVFQPEWGPDGTLYFVSDRSGWWNLYSEREQEIRPLAPMEAEFGAPQWVFGMSRYAFLDGGRIACVYSQGGYDHLGVIEPGSGRVRRLDLPFTSYHSSELRSDGAEHLFFLAGSPDAPTALVRLAASTGELSILRRSLALDVDPGFLSRPEPLEFETEGDETSHAIFYPPRNKDFSGPADEKPPLLVMSHGGPTGNAPIELSTKVQYWTSRGFAVVDVNYRGSTGYGREYRERLRGQWGIADTADCIQAARHLVREGKVDGKRMAIRGGSAGGYTTLCALVFHDIFATGASYYGVADLTALAQETHKFESRYLDRLIGPYPDAAELYRQRSPIHFADRLSCPVIIFQGLEDRVVPPAQAEVLVAALQGGGLPYAYVPFEGEQHGFRQAETVRRATESELFFYSRIFGFTPADAIEPVKIENFPAPQE